MLNIRRKSMVEVVTVKDGSQSSTSSYKKRIQNGEIRVEDVTPGGADASIFIKNPSTVEYRELGNQWGTVVEISSRNLKPISEEFPTGKTRKYSTEFSKYKYDHRRMSDGDLLEVEALSRNEFGSNGNMEDVSVTLGQQNSAVEIIEEKSVSKVQKTHTEETLNIDYEAVTKRHPNKPEPLPRLSLSAQTPSNVSAFSSEEKEKYKTERLENNSQSLPSTIIDQKVLDVKIEIAKGSSQETSKPGIIHVLGQDQETKIMSTVSSKISSEESNFSSPELISAQHLTTLENHVYSEVLLNKPAVEGLHKPSKLSQTMLYPEEVNVIENHISSNLPPPNEPIPLVQLQVDERRASKSTEKQVSSEQPPDLNSINHTGHSSSQSHVTLATDECVPSDQTLHGDQLLPLINKLSQNQDINNRSNHSISIEEPQQQSNLKSTVLVESMTNGITITDKQFVSKHPITESRFSLSEKLTHGKETTPIIIHISSTKRENQSHSKPTNDIDTVVQGIYGRRVSLEQQKTVPQLSYSSNGLTKDQEKTLLDKQASFEFDHQLKPNKNNESKTEDVKVIKVSAEQSAESKLLPMTEISENIGGVLYESRSPSHLTKPQSYSSSTTQILPQQFDFSVTNEQPVAEPQLQTTQIQLIKNTERKNISQESDDYFTPMIQNITQPQSAFTVDKQLVLDYPENTNQYLAASSFTTEDENDKLKEIDVSTEKPLLCNFKSIIHIEPSTEDSNVSDINSLSEEPSNKSHPLYALNNQTGDLRGASPEILISSGFSFIPKALPQIDEGPNEGNQVLLDQQIPKVIVSSSIGISNQNEKALLIEQNVFSEGQNEKEIFIASQAQYITITSNPIDKSQCLSTADDVQKAHIPSGINISSEELSDGSNFKSVVLLQTEEEAQYAQIRIPVQNQITFEDSVYDNFQPNVDIAHVKAVKITDNCISSKCLSINSQLVSDVSIKDQNLTSRENHISSEELKENNIKPSIIYVVSQGIKAEKNEVSPGQLHDTNGQSAEHNYSHLQ